MSGLFEHLAANDEMGRIAQRKAIAVATKRVNDRYADFILSEDDADAINERLDLVSNEFDQAVQDACDEHGVEDHEPIVAAIRQAFLEKASAKGMGSEARCIECESLKEDQSADLCHDCNARKRPRKSSEENMPEWLEEHFEEKNEGASKEEEDKDVAEEEDEDEKAKESSVKEARRPKMCPYHKELVNASLQVGEPQYAAFSSLVGGDAHCDGGYDDKCNFKPAMVTQAYWDEKEQARVERKERRELERQQAEQQSHEISPDEAAEQPVAEAVEDQASLSELDDAPSAVGEGVEEPILDSEPALEPALASSRWEITANEGEESPTLPGDRVINLEPNWEGMRRYVTHAYLTGDEEFANRMVAEMGREAPDPWPPTEFREAKTAAPKDGDSWEKNESVEQPEGPSPKMDKSKWNGLDPIDTDAGPYQTVQQDVTEGPDYSKQDDLGIATVDAVTEYTDAVTEQETLPTATDIDSAGFNTDKNIDANHTDTFDNNGQVEPVTQEVMANFQPRTSEEALNLHTADLLDDVKGFGQGVVDGAKGIGNAAYDAFNAVGDVAEGAGRAINENLLQVPGDSELMQPHQGIQPTGPDGKQLTPEEIQDMVGTTFKSGAAHKVKEEEGKFYVVEDGDEKAAGPFDSAEEAKERATELNAKENLEKETHSKEADAFNDFQNDLKDGLSDKGRELLEEDSYYPAENNDRLDQSIDFMSILVTAIEGGSNYWAEISDVQMNEQFGLPESATFTDHEDPSMGGVVNDEVIRRGIQLARDTQMNPDVKASIFEEGPAMDATAADVVVQLGLFGEIVFG